MGRCKHENADHLFPGNTFGQMIADSPLTPVLAECLRCIDCCAWLPLGPSNDLGVAHEIRAAEIATELADKGCTMSSLEVIGFNEEPMRLRNGAPIELDTLSQRAGYLAKCIAEHGGTP